MDADRYIRSQHHTTIRMIPLLIALGLLVLLAFYAIAIYNKLVKLKNLVAEAWSGIDVQLKKRYDLIPNLVETVKGYAAHEKETLENVTKARTAAQQATTVEGQQVAEKNLNTALMNLIAVAERYPDLKANTNFLELQATLQTVEGDIEKARRYYNGNVREQNTLIESFPSNIVANLFGFVKSVFFELDNPAEKQNPQVKFS
jgi:LemA protein